MTEKNMSISRRRYIKYVGAGAVAVAAAAVGGYYLNRPAPAPAMYEKGVIKVGVPAPISGWFASSAAEAVRCATMAIEDINAQGGLVGYRLEILTADAGIAGGPYTPEATRAAMTYLAGQGVDVMVTAYVQPITDVETAGELGIPYLHSDVVSGVSALVASDPEKYWMAFQCTPNEKNYGTQMAELPDYAEKAKGWKPINNKVALLTIDLGYNQGIRAAGKEAFAKIGWTVNIDEVFTSAQVEWGVILGKIRADPPAIIIFNDHVIADEATFMKQFIENPTPSLIWLQYGPAEPEFMDLAGQTAEGAVWATVLGAVPNATGNAWVERYKQRWGTNPGIGNGPGVYDEVMIWAEAVKKVGNPKDYRAVAAEILKTDYPNGNCGRYVFDQTTHDALRGADYMPTLVFQIQTLKNVCVLPTKYATGDFELPPWMH